MDEVEDVQAEASTGRRTRKSRLDQRLEQASAFSPEWFACLSHTPLHSRPVVLEMLREWAKHEIRARQLKVNDVTSGLDVIVANQLERLLNNMTPPSMFSRERPTPFPRFPLIGHFAIYSLNLILLRTVLVDSGYHVEHTQIGAHEDGTTPWEQLTFLWRSWFSLGNLASLTNIFSTEFENGTPILTPRKQFTGASPSTKSDLIKNVAATLGDDVTRVLVASSFGSDGPSDLASIIKAVERVELPAALGVLVRTAEEHGSAAVRELLPQATELLRSRALAEPLAFQRLHYLAEQHGFENELFEQLLGDVKSIGNWVERAPVSVVVSFACWCMSRRAEIGGDLIQHVIRRDEDMFAVGQAMRRARWRLSPSTVRGIVRGMRERSVNPELLRELPLETALEYIRIAREFGDGQWAHEAWRVGLRREPHELRNISPEVALDYIRIAREFGDGEWVNEAWWHGFRYDPHDFRHISPETALEYIRIAREFGDPGWADEVWQMGLRRDPHDLRRMSLEAAMDYMRIARDFGDPEWADEAWQMGLRRDPHDFRHISPETTLEYIRIARDFGDPEWADEVRHLGLRCDPQDLRHMSPENALEHFRIVREFDREWAGAAWRDGLRRDPLDVRHMSPDTALEYMRIAREFGDSEWADIAWRHGLRREPQNLQHMEAETSLDYLRVACELGDREWAEHGWRVRFGERDPRQFSHLDINSLIELLRVSQFVGDRRWMMRAAECWRTASRSFANLCDEETLALLNQVSRG